MIESVERRKKNFSLAINSVSSLWMGKCKFSQIWFACVNHRVITNGDLYEYRFFAVKNLFLIGSSWISRNLIHLHIEMPTVGTIQYADDAR